MDTFIPSAVSEIVDPDAPKPRGRPRQGFDPVIESMFADHKAKTSPVKLYAQQVTHLELITRSSTADSGETIQTVQCMENIAYLITVHGWDLVEDKDAFKKKRIIPAVRDLKAANPRKAVVVQYLDRNGTVIDDLPTVLRKD